MKFTESNICEEIVKAVEHFPGRVALQMYSDNGEVCYTYQQMLCVVRKLSAALKSRGFKKGEHIALWARLEPKWVLAYLGIVFSGCVAVPLDAEYESQQVASILEDINCALVFTTQEKLPALEKITSRPAKPLTCVALDSSHAQSGLFGLEDLFQDEPDDAEFARNAPEDVALIFYTSGTTGKPKGVVIQHQSVSNSVMGLLRYLDISPEDRLIAILPAHHVLASLANILIPLVSGASITYLQTVKSTELLPTIRRAKITVFPAVPQIFYLLHQRVFDEVQRKPLPLRATFKLLLRTCYWLRRGTGLNPGKAIFARIHAPFGSRLRLLISAASYFEPKVVEDLYGLGFTILQGYALTETFGGGTFTPVYHNVMGSVGPPIPGIKLQVVAPDERGVGEIAISGRSVMKGYFKDPDSTAKVLRDGWFYTGDLGYRDAEGNYYIVGRKKEMIVLSSGKKVHPEEVETHYLQSPYIKEMCVLGVADSAGYARSERLHAIIVPNFDYLKQQRIANSREIIREEIEKFSSALPAYKRILTYRVQTEPLPRTTTKKLMRWVVQKQSAAETGGADAFPERQHVAQEGDDLLLTTREARLVADLIQREFLACQVLHPDMNLELDLGLDSLQRIELLARIEQLLNIHLDEDVAGGVLTVRDLLRAVTSMMPEHETAAVEPAGPAHSPWQEILASPSVDGIAERYVLNASGVGTWVYFILLKLIFVLAKLLFKLEVHGLEHLPRQRPYLICPNHQSYLDGILILSVLPYAVVKHIFSIGYSPFFSGGVKNLFARLTRVVPVDPETNLVRAMKVSASCLKSKKILLIFPEGTRTFTGELQPFKKGSAILVRELRVPVLPVAIAGAFEVWPKASARIRLRQIKIAFAPPLQVEEMGPLLPDYDADYARITQRIRAEVNELLSLTLAGREQ
jgi:long-chain acyl-CoA synthetase